MYIRVQGQRRSSCCATETLNYCSSKGVTAPASSIAVHCSQLSIVLCYLGQIVKEGLVGIGLASALVGLAGVALGIAFARR